MSDVADELRQELRRLRGIIREQGKTIDQQNDRIDELECEDDQNTEDGTKDAQELVEVRTDDEYPTISDVWIAGLPFGRLLSSIQAKVNDDGGIIDRLIDLEVGGTHSADSDSGPRDDGRSPLAQVIDVPAERAKEALSENQRRGRRIAQRAKQLGTNTPNGLVVKSADIATQLTRWGESAHSETVSRVMAFIDEFGKGDVRSKLHKGKRILIFDPNRVNEYGTGDEPDVIVSHRDVIRPQEKGADPAPV